MKASGKTKIRKDEASFVLKAEKVGRTEEFNEARKVCKGLESKCLSFAYNAF